MDYVKLLELKKYWELALEKATSDSDKDIINKRIQKIDNQLGPVALKNIIEPPVVDLPVVPVVDHINDDIIKSLIAQRKKLQEKYNLFQDDDMLDDLNKIREELKKYNILDPIEVVVPKIFKTAQIQSDNDCLSFDEFEAIVTPSVSLESTPDQLYSNAVKIYQSKTDLISQVEHKYWDALFNSKESLSESELIDILLVKHNLIGNTANNTKMLNEIFSAEYDCLIVNENFPSPLSNHIYKRNYICQ